MRPFLLFLCSLFAGPAVAQGDYRSFIASLRAEHISVKAQGEVDQPFFSVKGKLIRLYDEHVQVFEYPSRAKADAEAARVSPNGRTVGTAKPHWLAPPHFYKKDKLVVLYLGTDERILKALAARLGAQFAGE